MLRYVRMESEIASAPKHRAFTVEQYHRMAEAGILGEDDRVELIDGEIVEMTPIDSRHAACVNKLNELFSQRVRNSAIVSVQNPVRLSTDSEPQPDLALLRPRADFYASRAPGPRDVLLLVEVADASLAYDRDFKLARYARRDIPEVWIVDLEGERVLVFRDPAGAVYHVRETASRGESLRPARLDLAALAVDELLV